MIETVKHRPTELLRGFIPSTELSPWKHICLHSRSISHHIAPSILLCSLCFILHFFVISPPGAHTYLLIQASARATTQKVTWTFKLTPMLHLQSFCKDTLLFPGSETLSWPVNAQVSCSNRSVGKRGPGTKGLQRSSFWLQWRDYFLTFVLEGIVLTQK